MNINTEATKDEPAKCRCGNEPLEPHPCPFAEEIFGDASECICCDDCAYQCAMDI